MPEEKKSSDEQTDIPLAKVKVKQEKIDPEVEAKINAISITNVVIKRESDKEKRSSQSSKTSGDYIVGRQDSDDGGDDDSSADDEESYGNSKGTGIPLDEDKKSIEPVKSSNEILAELFKVFNAAPPEELLNDENLLKKKGRKHKKQKKEKVKIKKEKELSDGEGSVSDSDDEGKHKHKHKHKKKKTHKVKDEKHKERSKSKDKSKKDIDKSKERPKSKEKSSEKSKENSRKLLSDSTQDHRRESKAQKRHADQYKDELNLPKKSRSEIDYNAYYSGSHDKSRERDKQYERDKEKETHRSKDRNKSKERKHNSFYNGYSEYETSSSKTLKIKQEPKDKINKQKSRGGHISEVSLSDDEEDYLRDRHGKSDLKRHRFGHDNGNGHPYNSFYAGSNHSRSRDQDGDRNRDRERERDKNYHGDGYSRNRQRSRGRSRSRSRDLGIDKKRLLEIARKNAISMFKRGSLPGCDGMSEELKDKVLLKMRYGGKTVQDLTDFCKKISNGENLSDLSSDEDSDVDKSGNTKAFHHPFQLKEREPIVMHIRNSNKLPLRPSTSEQVKAITMQFPVSSGERHRMTEAWVPVVPKESLPPLPALPAATQSTSIFKADLVKNVFEKPIPDEQQEPAFKPAQPPSTEESSIHTNNTIPTESASNDVLVPDAALATTESTVPTEAPAPAAKPLIDPAIASKPYFAMTPPIVIATASTPAALSVPPATAQHSFVPDVPVPSSRETPSMLFPEQSGTGMDVSSIISKRLLAMRRLQENPMDPEAIKMMYNSQKDMSSWASSKYLPGQFTGSTGANILTTRELHSGPQAWARRDQLITSRPVSGGMGMQLLQKMGWKPGEGLGRDKTGSIQPLLLDVKLDKHGLVARDDNLYNGYKQNKNKKPRPQNIAQQQQAITEKHPVCLLNELTSKRKWTPPLYTLMNEAGPSHSRMFLFSVSINGQTYTPTQGSNTKKEAKVIAARYCLQQMGILPPT
ncbi:protein Son [Eurosta solidaginis]|uniref:protein Son n=1 Tax=Eurosta solidaginis TaxID=178769 RepID=UPI0035310F6B